MFKKDDGKVKVSNAQIATFIGADTKIEGTIISKTSVRIDGTIVGGVCANGTVVLSKSGQIKGNVIAENIIIAGVVDGNMQIKDKTNIEPTGEVYGDITTSRILIDEQSVFQGKCNMNISREGKKPVRNKPASKPVKEQEEPAAKEVTKEAAKEAAKEATKEATKEAAKEATKEVKKEASGETVKEDKVQPKE